MKVGWVTGEEAFQEKRESQQSKKKKKKRREAREVEWESHRTKKEEVFTFPNTGRCTTLQCEHRGALLFLRGFLALTTHELSVYP